MILQPILSIVSQAHISMPFFINPSAKVEQLVPSRPLRIMGFIFDLNFYSYC